MRDRTDLGRRRARYVSWRRRHLNLRVCVALVALASLIAPGVVAIAAMAL
jgi:hypothetical protein